MPKATFDDLRIPIRPEAVREAFTKAFGESQDQCAIRMSGPTLPRGWERYRQIRILDLVIPTQANDGDPSVLLDSLMDAFSDLRHNYTVGRKQDCATRMTVYRNGSGGWLLQVPVKKMKKDKAVLETPDLVGMYNYILRETEEQLSHLLTIKDNDWEHPDSPAGSVSIRALCNNPVLFVVQPKDPKAVYADGLEKVVWNETQCRALVQDHPEMRMIVNLFRLTRWAIARMDKSLRMKPHSGDPKTTQESEDRTMIKQLDTERADAMKNVIDLEIFTSLAIRYAVKCITKRKDRVDHRATDDWVDLFGSFPLKSLPQISTPQQ